MKVQDSVFLNKEGDQWFLRNGARLQPTKKIINDPPLSLIQKFSLRPRTVLEVGSSNGYRLAQILLKHKTTCFAVEPSLKAIQDGRRNYPRINFARGLIHDLPSKIRARTYDLVIVNFVFHWVARENLLKAVAEIDRVVKRDGFLIIGDFYPPSPEKVPYHHLPGKNVWTFKQDYAQIFLASSLYEKVGMIRSVHERSSEKFLKASSEVATFLLKKCN